MSRSSRRRTGRRRTEGLNSSSASYFPFGINIFFDGGGPVARGGWTIQGEVGHLGRPTEDLPYESSVQLTYDEVVLAHHVAALGGEMLPAQFFTSTLVTCSERRCCRGDIGKDVHDELILGVALGAADVAVGREALFGCPEAPLAGPTLDLQQNLHSENWCEK